MLLLCFLLLLLAVVFFGLGWFAIHALFIVGAVLAVCALVGYLYHHNGNKFF